MVVPVVVGRKHPSDLGKPKSPVVEVIDQIDSIVPDKFGIQDWQESDPDEYCDYGRKNLGRVNSFSWRFFSFHATFHNSRNNVIEKESRFER